MSTIKKRFSIYFMIMNGVLKVKDIRSSKEGGFFSWGSRGSYFHV